MHCIVDVDRGYLTDTMLACIKRDESQKSNDGLSHLVDVIIASSEQLVKFSINNVPLNFLHNYLRKWAEKRSIWRFELLLHLINTAGF